MSETTIIVLIVVLAMVAVAVPWVIHAKTNVTNKNELQIKDSEFDDNCNMHCRDRGLVIPIERGEKNKKLG